MKRRALAGSLLATLALLATACGGGGSSASGGDSAASPTNPSKVSGEITVLTQRTDLVDTVFKQYAGVRQNPPEVKVSFQGITDYEGEVKIRMSSQDYGDVLLIPESITPEQLPVLRTARRSRGAGEEVPVHPRADLRRHRPTGSPSPATRTASCTTRRSGSRPGSPLRQGHLPSSSPTLRAIKAKTGATPLYTNYRNGWPLAQWEDLRASVAGQPDVITTMADTDAPWTPGSPQEAIDTLLFDAVAGKLTEDDPTTTDWETSKKTDRRAARSPP